jgi:hypothetical protein
VTEQQQTTTQKQQVNKQTNKQTTHMAATPPLGTVKPLQEGRKEGNAGKVHISGWGDFLEHQRQGQYSTPVMGSK